MAARYSQSKALRTIGQELKRRGIDLFELRCRRKEYYLQCGDPNPPYLGMVEITLSNDDLESLERAVAALRGNQHTFVNFDALPELLRAIGRYIENKDGTLLRVSNLISESDQEMMRVEYHGPEGHVHVEELTLATLSETATRMYKERVRTSKAAANISSAERSWRY
ncbi:MAG: hypothetical protein EXR70_13460 [Deltaproteobacteria bacterium]|nr:hypothetical protein [Deltaproteobacteria bacterium]